MRRLIRTTRWAMAAMLGLSTLGPLGAAHAQEEVPVEGDGTDDLVWVEGHYDEDGQWIEGYWQWDDSQKDYVWVTGTWRVPPPTRANWPTPCTETTARATVSSMNQDSSSSLIPVLVTA